MRHTMRSRALPAFTALLLAASPLAANSFTSPAAMDAAVADFLGAPVGAPGGAARQIDAKLKLAACGGGLDVAWYGNAGTTVLVSCQSRGWRVFVPVGGHGTASVRGRMDGETIVKRNETVSLVYEGSGFTLTRQGEALEPGSRGQWIKIKPVGDNAKPVSGEVVGPGLVRVSGAS